MPSKIKKRVKKNSFTARLDDKTTQILLRGDLVGMFLKGEEAETRKAEFKKLWMKHRDYLMGLWQSKDYKDGDTIKQRAFNRPWGWIEFESSTIPNEPKFWNHYTFEYKRSYLIRTNQLLEFEKEVLKKDGYYDEY